MQCLLIEIFNIYSSWMTRLKNNFSAMLHVRRKQGQPLVRFAQGLDGSTSQTGECVDAAAVIKTAGQNCLMRRSCRVATANARSRTIIQIKQMPHNYAHSATPTDSWRKIPW